MVVDGWCGWRYWARSCVRLCVIGVAKGGEGRTVIRLLTHLAGLPHCRSPLGLSPAPLPTDSPTTTRNDGLHPLLEGRG